MCPPEPLPLDLPAILCRLLIPVVVLAELVTLKKHVSLRRALLLLLVVLGTAMSVATDFASTWAGVAIAAVWLPLSAMLKVSWAAAEKEVRCSVLDRAVRSVRVKMDHIGLQWGLWGTVGHSGVQ